MIAGARGKKKVPEMSGVTQYCLAASFEVRAGHHAVGGLEST
jgi:hypothetical protein